MRTILLLSSLSLIACSEAPPSQTSADAAPTSDVVVTTDAPSTADAAGDGAHSDNGTPRDASPQAVTVRFRAMVGAMPFACTSTFSGLGTAMSRWTPQDFRFYVHDVRLVTATGSEVALTLADEAPWQRAGVALLDFEDHTGACAEGTTATNTSLRGSAPEGRYVGLKFRLGVPFESNHANAATAQAPLNVSSMFWSWNSGYKFLKIDGRTSLPGFNIHVGSTGCVGNGAGMVSMCASPNRPEITLMGFDPTTQTVVADLASLVANVNVDQSTGSPGCMSGGTDPECPPIFRNLGIAVGGDLGAQSFFRAE